VFGVFIFYSPKSNNSFGFKCASDFETAEEYVDSLAQWISKYTKKYPGATTEEMMAVRDKLIEQHKCEKPPFTIDDSATDLVNLEEPVLPKQVSWEGKVMAKLTYARLRLSKLTIDDQYSQFIAEPTDVTDDGPWADSPATKNVKVGDIVNITGEWESTDNGILPWVTIEKIKPSPNKLYIFKNLGFSFKTSNDYYPLMGTEDTETIYMTSYNSKEDNKEGIIITARKSSPDSSALDWLKSEYSSYEFTNGYKTTKIEGQETYLLNWHDPNVMDGVLLNNPDKTRRITISILGDNPSPTLKRELDKIINTFSFKP
jgi:hypothetical protein